jgi:type IV pilus assembly protein PilX
MTANLRNRQQGAVLIVALIFLVILTMLGVTAMTGTTMEQRMAGNARDLAIALQAAEAAVRDAHRDIYGVAINAGIPRVPPMVASDFGAAGAPGTCNVGQQKGLCSPRLPNPGGQDAILPPSLTSAPSPINMTANPSVQYGEFTGAQLILGVAQQPRYIIEVFCLPKYGASLETFCKFYRITARGYGGNPNSQVTLQEIYVTD